MKYIRYICLLMILVGLQACRRHKAGDACAILVGDSMSMDFVWCPPGEFDMGLNYAPGGWHDAKMHRVRLTKGFWIGKYEVTRRQWRQMGESAHLQIFRNVEEAPVQEVEWDEAVRFCEKMNGMSNGESTFMTPSGTTMKGRFRLPTEAEWEYACRATTTGPFNFEGKINYNKVNYYGNLRVPPSSAPVKVGSYPPNRWGIHDMHGNVREWVSDWHGEYPSGPVIDPTGPSFLEPYEGSEERWKVRRGGGYVDSRIDCQSGARLRSSCATGIRVVFEPL
jgi:formylglycine-generating enzyme